MRTQRWVTALLGSALLSVGLPATFAGAATAEVEVVDFAFEPEALQIAPGDSVTWTNTGIADHTVTADDGSFSHLLLSGESVTIPFPTAAEIAYFCRFHGGAGGGGMAGTVTVGDPPQRQDPVTLSATSGVGAAIAWSKLAFPSGGSDFALLARDDVFADGLSSGAAQGALGAPLLLTPTASLADETKTELARLGVSRVVVLGGPNAVSDNVVSQLEAAGYSVERIAGGSRIETAVALGDRFLPAARSAILARAFAGATDPTQAFADALGAGALAAATSQPILLTDTGALSAATKAYLASHPIKSITVAGGPGAVSDAVVTELEGMGITVERAAAGGRAGTAVQMAMMHPGSGQVLLVDGGDPAGWTSGFPAAVVGSPVLLTSADGLPEDTVLFLIESGLELVCAPNVAPAACDKADAAATSGGLFIGAGAYGVLEGGNEVPPVDTPVTGVFAMAGTNSPTAFCYQYFTNGLTEDVAAAHIHEGAAGANGGPVVTLSTTPAPWDPAQVVSCAFDVDAALVSDILANPSDYYVNVHTAAQPSGLIRGQLFVPENMFLADLIGEADQPGEGDPDGIGFGIVLVKGPAELCVDVFHMGLQSDPVASHIHEGDVGNAGPPVLTLDTPDPSGSGPTRCYTVPDEDGGRTGEQVVDAIQADPNGFYINVHTEDHPGGAIRGQLLDPFDQVNRGSASGAATASRAPSRWNG